MTRPDDRPGRRLDCANGPETLTSQHVHLGPRNAVMQLLADTGLWAGPVELDFDPRRADEPHPLWWAASGGMWLTGASEPTVPRMPVLQRAQEVADAIAFLALPQRVLVDVPTTLFGRAAIMGFRRGGRTAPGGACRLLRTSDGWAAISVSRTDDVYALEALLGEAPAQDPWETLAGFARRNAAGAFVARAQLVGIPAAELPSIANYLSPIRVSTIGLPSEERNTRLIVDLSAMWAGPLCARILGRAGGRVVKIEAKDRPDGARLGSPPFFQSLHEGHEFMTLDFSDAAGVNELHKLVEAADIVIESSRPRALKQLGLDAADIVSRRPGVTWISITGYGRDDGQPDRAGRVAFGDDAAVAGGLVAYDAAGDPVFCGDAIADPLTGLYAAAAGLASRQLGGGHLIDIPMQGVAAHVARPMRGDFDENCRVTGSDAIGWRVQVNGRSQPILPPGAP